MSTWNWKTELYVVHPPSNSQGSEAITFERSLGGEGNVFPGRAARHIVNAKCDKLRDILTTVAVAYWDFSFYANPS